MKRIYPHPFFAREGWPFMAAFFLLAFVVDCFVDGIIAFFFWLLFLFVLNFFRDPAREMTEDANAVVSPVDGRVVKIEEAMCPYTGKKMRMISIFMNVFNVHSQKAPVAGTVTKVEYFKGKFFNAALDKASTDNERNAVVVKTHAGDTVCFVQIAGLVARRILCYTHVGDVLERGSRYGFIRFGSRVDVYLPLTSEVSVVIGDKVTGVASVIVRLKKPAV